MDSRWRRTTSMASRMTTNCAWNTLTFFLDRSERLAGAVAQPMRWATPAGRVVLVGPRRQE